jgi:pseudouridylate synthase
MTSWDKQYFSILPEVDQALRLGKPVVALESTVITHGLPFPQNVQLVADLEAQIRDQDCIPATISILAGKIHLGMDKDSLDYLVGSDDVLKISHRDIASALLKNKSGGTTVAGTLAIARAVGIKVFATGGIGGVHRGSSFDVSADLLQLSQSRLVVVCAGAKAILDIHATLEVLETYGVPVIGFQTNEFPAFYSTSSGYPVSAQVDSLEEVANIARSHWDLGMSSAVLVVVPPPPELALEHGFVESAIQAALEEMQQKGINGQAVTPYLLNRVSELTHGTSLQANLGLLRNNARIAAGIARYLYTSRYN